MAFVTETWSWKWTQQNIYNPFNLYLKSSQNISLIFFVYIYIYLMYTDYSLTYLFLSNTKYLTLLNIKL